ncbi:MAG: TetR family transcriptional regulator [Actinobacteria bacterium]|nr:TetR family transcriptional regulator [Actinomycetota bacterium]
MPRASVAELRRGEIVDGAIRLIARAGYEATTMRGLAAELDVSTGTITHWFATKDHVLGATLEELAARFATRIEAELAGADGPRAELIAIGDASVPDTPERADEQRVWGELAARAARTPALAELHGRLYAGWRRRMERAVQAGAARGELRAVDAADWARTYAALLDGLGLHALLHPASISPARMRAAIRAHVDGTLAPGA